MTSISAVTLLENNNKNNYHYFSIKKYDKKFQWKKKNIKKKKIKKFIGINNMLNYWWIFFNNFKLN